MLAESGGIVQESAQISEEMMPVLTVVMMLFMFKCLCKYSGCTDIDIVNGVWSVTYLNIAHSALCC